MIRKSMVLFALAALAACGDGAADEATAPDATAATEEAAVDPTEAGFEAVAPGDYDVVHADGSVDKLTVHPGMTWSMVSANGEPTGGTIFAQAGKNCFVTEGVEGHRCFSGTPPAEDGSIEVTGDDGETATVRPTGA